METNKAKGDVLVTKAVETNKAKGDVLAAKAVEHTRKKAVEGQGKARQWKHKAKGSEDQGKAS